MRLHRKWRRRLMRTSHTRCWHPMARRPCRRRAHRRMEAEGDGHSEQASATPGRRDLAGASHAPGREVANAEGVRAWGGRHAAMLAGLTEEEKRARVGRPVPVKR